MTKKTWPEKKRHDKKKIIVVISNVLKTEPLVYDN